MTTSAEFLSIAEMAERTGLSRDTLRWYEGEGLLPPVPRDSAGRRRYDERSIARIELVLRLRRTGMPVREMRRFVELLGEGGASHPQRLDLLAAHRVRILAELARVEGDLRAVDDKIAHYSELVAAGLDCDGNPYDHSPDTTDEDHR